MNKQLLMSALLAAMLVACSSKPVKTTSAPGVEDKSMTTESTTAGSADGASTAGTDTSGLAGNPLTDPNNILSKRSIYFDFDKDEVKSEFRPLVEAHAKYLTSNSGAKVILQGNTDDAGTHEYNLSLGQRRAVAVKNVMNVLGVQDAQIETVSYGEEKAKSCAGDQACGEQDRRVDIIYVGE
ncbi:MAG TPA: OmpA family protein [Methylophilaceae bacterium]|jgi:peptidoglycan-associated lipoprotein|nr:OmpA family protein [Methylophilaceae bacterium]